MNINTEALQHYRKLAASQQGAALDQDWDWLQETRESAADQVQALNLPSRQDEPWHYASLNQLLQHQFKAVTADDDVILSYSDIKDLVLGDADDIRIVLFNGSFNAELSNLPTIAGLQISSIHHALTSKDEDIKRLGSLSGKGAHIFSAMNTAMMSDGAYIKVAKDTVLKQPIELLHISMNFSGSTIAQPRNLIILEENAQATLVESYAAPGDVLCFNNIISEVFVGKSAKLHHARLQNESQRSFHLAGLHVSQDADSLYQCTSASLGAAWSRTEFNVTFAQPGAHCDLNGLYIADGNQVNDTWMNVVHAVPECSSNEHFKGLLKDHGKAAFDGTVRVEKDAQKTDAHLANHNLLLSRDAEIDAKPVLEINADDVKCSHGTTVGQIDPDKLFYLRARGITEQEARKMICLGFAGEILQSFQWQPVRERAEAILQQRLQHIPRIVAKALH